MKGILLAGGLGTRLYPITAGVSKHLVPVFSKPLVYYSLSSLLLAQIRDIVVISDENSLDQFKNIFHDGHHLGISMSYLCQTKPEGIPQAFSIAENFIGDDEVCLALGDNIFYGSGFGAHLRTYRNIVGAQIFGIPVANPKEYGVVELDQNNDVISIEEKPLHPKSNLAIPGLYFYDNSVVSKSKSLSKSSRGEFEITDLNNIYLSDLSLNCNVLSRGITWLDAGTTNSLFESQNFIQAVESRQNILVGSPEEICWRNGWLDSDQLKNLINKMPKSHYSNSLRKVSEI
jgi:glucose-1-phosphate thymidylyltransferase